MLIYVRMCTFLLKQQRYRAVDTAEACGGTFDSSGAFHGYSNDDSNLPKNQENPYRKYTK